MKAMQTIRRGACLLGVLALGLARAGAVETENATATVPAPGRPITTAPAPTPQKTTPPPTSNATAPSSQAPEYPVPVPPTPSPVPAAGPKEVVVAPPMSAASWFDQKYLTGDWGGERTRLENRGVVFGLSHIEDFLTDVTGDQSHHAVQFGRFRASLDLDLKKLADWNGEFYFTGIYQYGQNISGDFLNVNTLTSSIAGRDSLRLDEAWYQQGFWGDRVKLKAGQVAIVNDFGSNSFGDILVNDELGAAPNPLFIGQPSSPAGKPAVELQFDLLDLSPGLYAEVAAYTAYVDAYNPDDDGFHFGDDFQHGVGYSAEVGYAEQKTSYPGIYRFGVNINDLDHYQDYSLYNPAANTYFGAPERGDYTIYGLAEKTVYRPRLPDGTLDLHRGFDLMTEVVYGPGDRNLLSYAAQVGARYTGPFTSRPEDKVGAGFVISQEGYHASNAYSAATGRGHLQGEETVELTYQYHVADWFLIQPDLQYIFAPRGDMNRDDILIVGVRTVVIF